MVLNTKAAKALDSKNEKALAEALAEDYSPEAAAYLAKKLLGLLPDDKNVII